MITKPLSLPTHDDNNDLWSEEVMLIPTVTLREYYAGWAMQAVIRDTRDRETCARAAVEYADALIAELQKEEDNNE